MPTYLAPIRRALARCSKGRAVLWGARSGDVQLGSPEDRHRNALRNILQRERNRSRLYVEAYELSASGLPLSPAHLRAVAATEAGL